MHDPCAGRWFGVTGEQERGARSEERGARRGGGARSEERERSGVESKGTTLTHSHATPDGAKIQLLDLPGIIEGAAHGKGRGRQVIAVAKTADLVLMVLDAGKERTVANHRGILEKELETVGLRLNKKPADITYRVKKTGGIKFTAVCKVTKLGDDPADTVRRVLAQYKVHNAEILFREDATVDELIDVVQGNRHYVPCLYAYNKVDTITVEEM